jgi:hypothetical protein
LYHLLAAAREPCRRATNQNGVLALRSQGVDESDPTRGGDAGRRVYAHSALTTAQNKRLRRDECIDRGRADICEELVAFVEKAAADTSKPTTQANGAARSPAAPPAPATSNASPDTSQRQSGVSAPVPQGETASAPVKLSLEEARSLAGAHDVRGCQRAVQQMRRAGAARPPGLLALAALREDLVSEMPRPAH